MTEWQRVRAVADRARPGLRRLLESAWRQHGDAIPWTRVRGLLARGDLLRAEELVVSASAGAALEEGLRRQLHGTLGSAGEVAAKALGGRFDVVNPEAVLWARTRAATLVRAIDDGQREAIRRVTARVQRGDLTVDAAARRLRGVVGLDARRAEALEAYAERVRGQLAGVRRRTVRERLERSVARYERRLLRDRALTIAHTESMMAANRGQLAAWEQAQAKGLAVGREKRWVVTRDDHLCPTCRPLARQQRRLGEPFVSGRYSVQSPPLHPRCRCAMVLAPARSATAAAQSTPTPRTGRFPVT